MKVSIVCTVYNHEKYLRSALEGFVNQKTNFEYEVIIHDDASTDNSAVIIKEYEKKYPNIIKPIYQKENQYTREKKGEIDIFKDFIFPKITGEYIAYCEGDDYWIDNKKLQKQVDFLDNHLEYSACVHNYQRLDCNSGKLKTMHKSVDKDISLVDSFNGTMANYQTATLMHRYEYGKRDSELFDVYVSIRDNPLTVYLALNGKIRFLGEVMSVYRYKSIGSWSSRNYVKTSFNIQFQKKHIEFYNCIKKYVSKEYYSILDEKILESKFHIEFFKENIKCLKKEPFKKIYKTRSFKYKLAINLYPLYKVYRKLTTDHC